MASLKEVKNRIASVTSTRKITLARQMVSSAQLHHMQGVLENATTYKEALDKMVAGLSVSSGFGDLPLVRKHGTGPVAVIIMSSNSGMCGSFNANMIKTLEHIRAYYPQDELLFFPIGRKIREAAEHAACNIGFEKGENMDHLANKVSFSDIQVITSKLVEMYLHKKIKQVDLIYYEYKNMAIQEITETTLLPYPVPPVPEDYENKDYIFEPSEVELTTALIPMALRSNLYYALVENQTSEHAARTMAMQLATENADAILVELQLNYNKLRQQNITSELLDIIGSSFA